MNQQDQAEKVADRTRFASKRVTNIVIENPNPSARGRPPKKTEEINPYEKQTQFSEEFIEFGRIYLQWNLNQNYVWRVDFEKRSPAEMEKIQIIENPIFEQFISTLILNMTNMMEPQVGKEFREICILSYKYYITGKYIEYAKKQIIEKVMTLEEYSYLGLHNTNIPIKNRKIKEQILVKFIGSIVELIYRTATQRVGNPFL